MLKQKRQFFALVYIFSDLIVVSFAWVFSFWFRFYSGFVEVLYGVPAFMPYAQLIVIILLIWAIVYKRFGLYKPMRSVRRSHEVWLILNSTALAVILLIALTYLFQEKSNPYSRLVFIYFGIFSALSSIALRLFLRFFLREIRRRGYNLRYILIVGSGQVARDVSSRVRLNRQLGIQLIGCLTQTGKQGTERIKSLPVLGSYAQLRDLLKTTDIDQVVVALPLEEQMFLPEILEQISDSLVDVKIVPDLYRFVSVGGSIEEFEGLPVINIQDSPLHGFNLRVKRSFDLCLSAITLLVLSPLLLLLAVIVKLTSKGPVFYAQERASIDGKAFKIYKFRSMVTGAEDNGPGWTVAGDQRVTWIGRIMRPLSLDELPQFFNVLRGDMSLVGPRPERPVYISEFKGKYPRYLLRHKVPAGITGWAQVNGWRGDTEISKRVEFDLYYISNWSVLLDLKILLLTVLTVWKKENNAY